MKIALLGGTGDIGTGFAMRFAKKHEVIIGSRKIEKAEQSASCVTDALGGAGLVRGTDNASAVHEAEVIILCVPYEHLSSVTSDLSAFYSDQIVVSPVVPMAFSGRQFIYTPPAHGSAAMQAKAMLPPTVRLVASFHTICARSLQDQNLVLFGDVPTCSDDIEAMQLVFGLTSEIKSLRPLAAGPLAASNLVESLTPLILNVARQNKMKDLGVRFVSER